MGLAIRVLIHEWVTGGGLAGAPLPSSLAVEGRALRRAIAADFHEVPGVEVVTTLDPRFAGEEHPWTSVAVGEGEEPAALQRLSAASDFTLVVAPETDGVLAERCRWVEAGGGLSLGSTPAAVALAGDKLALAAHLARFGVPTPPTIPFRPGDRLPAGFAVRAILKPRDGAGALRTFLLHGPSDLPRLDDHPRSMILQPFVPGEPMSATFLVAPSGAVRLIGVGWQTISTRGGVVTYQGGRLAAPRAFGLGSPVEAVRSVPGLRGVVGVDFLRDSGTGETTVIEINPRPTTSYAGLVRLLAPGAIARAWIEAFRGGLPVDDVGGMIPDDVGDSVAFLPDGSINV